MRDALSLPDQAIAFSNNDIRLETVQAMLGTIDSAFLAELMESLCRKDAQAMLATVDRMHQQGLSFTQALADWAELLSQIAIVQQIPAAREQGQPLAEQMTQWAQVIRDRKSTRLNSSHVAISYAVFCLKKNTTSRQHPRLWS